MKPSATVTYLSSTGGKREIAVPIGMSVMEGAFKNDVEGIVAACGGACGCATCHVYVDESWLDKLPPMAEDEEDMLENTFAQRLPNSRLSCQIPVTAELDGLVVTTPEAQE